MPSKFAKFAKPAKEKYKLIGVISDTHGLMRPEALKALEGVDMVIHAGDIGTPEVIQSLRSIASVVAVRGNIDQSPWARTFPEEQVVKVGRTSIYVLHDVQQMERNPILEGLHAVVSGHSHCPSIKWRNGVLFVNPGSAGPRRFNLPIAVGRIRITGTSIDGEIIELNV